MGVWDEKLVEKHLIKDVCIFSLLKVFLSFLSISAATRKGNLVFAYVGCVLCGMYSWIPECPRGDVVTISHMHVWNSSVLQIRSIVRYESCLGRIFLQCIAFSSFLLFWVNPGWYCVRDTFDDFYFFKGIKPTGSDLAVHSAFALVFLPSV